MTALPLAVNRLVYNHFDHLLYASVPSSQGANGNSIAVIDPMVPALLRTVYVGSEPNVLALSDDGQTIWVGLDGADAVRRFDIATSTAGLQFSLPLGQQARDIAVLAGTDDSIAVSVAATDAEVRVVIFDDGIPRPYAFAQFASDPRFLAPSYSPALLYANEYASISRLFTLCVNASGVFRDDAEYTDLTGHILFAQGILYAMSVATRWRVDAFDIGTRANLGGYVNSTSVSSFAPDPATSRVFLLSDINYPATITAYDQATFVPVATDSFDVSLPAANLVRWGRYGFAFTAAGPSINMAAPSLIIARSSNIPPQP